MSNKIEKNKNIKNSILNRIFQIMSFAFFMFLAARGYMQSVYDTRSNVAKKMEKYLYDEYGEEFDVYFLREIEGAYTAYVKKLADVGTPKGEDSYYLATVTMRTERVKWGGYNKHKNIFDSQWRVVLNEKLNNIVGKEVEKIFGKNYLSILKMDVNIDTIRNEPELIRKRKTVTLTDDEVLSLFKRNEIDVIGVFHIFGRVETDEDRELYREKIFEFIQYLKKEKIFDNSSIGFVVSDERILAKDFNKREFLSLYENDTSKTKDNYRVQRRELIKKYDKSFKKTTDKEKKEKIDNIIKSDLFGGKSIPIDGYIGQNELLYSAIIGYNYIEKGYERRKFLLETNTILPNYNLVESIEEIHFIDEKY